jgi:hypothetical protein
MSKELISDLHDYFSGNFTLKDNIIEDLRGIYEEESLKLDNAQTLEDIEKLMRNVQSTFDMAEQVRKYDKIEQYKRLNKTYKYIQRQFSSNVSAEI